MADQLDIFRHGPKALIAANRMAAEIAAIDPNFSPQLQRERSQYYLDEAARLERDYPASENQ